MRSVQWKSAIYIYIYVCCMYVCMYSFYYGTFMRASMNYLDTAHNKQHISRGGGGGGGGAVALTNTADINTHTHCGKKETN